MFNNKLFYVLLKAFVNHKNNQIKPIKFLVFRFNTCKLY